jgi:hypothetical protein
MASAITPAPATGTRYYRSLLLIEVLSDRPGAADTDLAVLARETATDSSGQVTVLVADQEVSAGAMAELLIAQNSDPEFLIPIDDPYWDRNPRS